MNARDYKRGHRATVASLRVKVAKVVDFCQFLPIVQITNSITYVESGRKRTDESLFLRI